jgi:O-antigen/teichoic acid export membrane protein
MASEALRGAVRVSSNYARQLLSLLVSIAQVAILLSWIGEDGYGLAMLITSTVGIPILVDDVIRTSLIRELAQAHHSGEERYFRDIYNSAWVVTSVGAAVSAVLFAIMIAALGLFNIESQYLWAARWMLTAECIWTCVFILIAPATNMYLIREQFLVDNTWTMLRRLSYPLAALIGWKFAGIRGIDSGALFYVVLYNALNLVIILLGAGLVIGSSHRYLPVPWRATRPALREILSTFGWNSLVTIALNLYERLPALIVNHFFGLVGNAVYGIAIQFASYVRMLTMGLNFGLDAVAARITHESNQGGGIGLAQFTRTYTQLHAIAALPGAALLFLLMEPLVRLWIAGRVKNPEQMLPLVYAMVPILLVPVLVRAISDCWVRILYGAGYIKRLVPVVTIGGILNPIAAVVLYRLLPEPMRMNAPALAYAGVFTIFQVFLLPIVAARTLKLSVAELILPIWKPLVVTLICCPILIVGRSLLRPDSIPELAILGAAFGAAYMLLTAFFVLTRGELHRFRQAVRRRLGRRGNVELAIAMSSQSRPGTDATEPSPVAPQDTASAPDADNGHPANARSG